MNPQVYDKMFRMGFVPVLCAAGAAAAVAAAGAVWEGGVSLVELDFTQKGAAEQAAAIAHKYPQLAVGAGSVAHETLCAQALEAGVSFVIGDSFDEACLSACQARDVLYIPTCTTLAAVKAAQSKGVRLVNYVWQADDDNLAQLARLSAPYADLRFIISLAQSHKEIGLCCSAPFVSAVRGTWLEPAAKADSRTADSLTAMCERLITEVLGFKVYHIGINMETAEGAVDLCDELHDVFRLQLRDNGPSSRFAGTGIEVMKRIYRGAHGHFAVRTNNCDRAILFLKEKGYEMDWDTCYINGGRIGTIYLKDEHCFGGFAAHLLQRVYPDAD